MSIKQLGQDYEGADRFKVRHFRSYLVSFSDVPIWSIGSFIKMLNEQADGMILDTVQIAVSVKLTTCTLSEFDDAELRKFEVAMEEQFIDTEISLLEQNERPPLAQLDAGFE